MQISQFGQCPDQLFSVAHPKRLSKKDCRLTGLVLPIAFHKGFTGIVVRSSTMMEQPMTLKICKDGRCLKVCDVLERVLSFDLPNMADLDLEAAAAADLSSSGDGSPSMKKTSAAALIKSWMDSAFSASSDPPAFELLSGFWSETIVYQNFVVAQNGNYGISAGYLDFSLKVHELGTGRIVQSVTGLENGHNDVITCLCLDSNNNCLITGAQDGSVVYWTTNCSKRGGKGGPTESVAAAVVGKPYRLLSIHFDAVRVIALDYELGIIVSGADDSTMAVYSIARKRFIRQLEWEGRYGNKYMNRFAYREIIKIVISKLGYIAVHSLDDSVPFLRVFSLNGVLCAKKRLTEILFAMKMDNTGRYLITAGQACVVNFRNIWDLRVSAEITVSENVSKKHAAKVSTPRKKGLPSPSASAAASPGILDAIAEDEEAMTPLPGGVMVGASKKVNAQTLNTLTPFQSHSSAWRSQRFSYSGTPGLDGSKRKSVVSQMKDHRRSVMQSRTKSTLSVSMTESGRRSSHFHGRFSSVDGEMLISASHIIDFDLDEANTFIVVAYIDVDEMRSDILMYPLPNLLYDGCFDKYLSAATKLLSEANTTIWDVNRTVDERPDATKVVAEKVTSAISAVKGLFSRGTGGVR